MGWTEPQFSKNAVRKAGELLGSGTGDAAAIADAREKVSNFRSSHSYPLTAITMHVRQYARRVTPDAVVARRLKRLPTILDKLQRQPNMNVTTMQDLGGCRVVLPTVEQVTLLVENLKESPRAKNAIVRTYDYLHDMPGPQATGYRGMHLVYEYRASKAAFVGQKIEVQIRTDLQHAWATAVETLDLFGNTRLKYAEADPDHSRYFILVSALMADAENLPRPAGILGTADAIRDELERLDDRIGLTDRLAGYVAFVEQFSGRSDRGRAIIMKLHRAEHDLAVSFFETIAEAQAELAKIEEQNDDNIDAVLVGMSQVGQLQSAYPNYFANTAAFTEFVGVYLSRSDA